MKKTDCVKLTAKPPELQSSQPTDLALELNIRRAHFQALWHNCFDGRLPSKDPREILHD